MTSNSIENAFDPELRQSQFPRMPTQRDSLRIDAIRRKLVEPVNKVTGREGTPIRMPDAGMLQNLSHKTASDIKDVENLMQLLPDTELSMQILTSSILSPKDLLNTEIHYSVDGNRFTSELTNALLNPIRDHFENEHKIIEVLPEWLKDALFRTGSYATAILPESSIDDAINSHARVSHESIMGEFDPTTKRLYSIGALGNISKLTETTSSVPGLEDYVFQTNLSSQYTEQDVTGLNLSIVDNPQLLKLPILRDKVRKDHIQKLYRGRNLALESFEDEKDKDNSIYRQRRYTYTPVMTMRSAKTASKRNFGHPLAMHLPSESVIPVHVPGNPSQHVAYFLVVDEHGNPISLADKVDFYRQMGTSLSNTSSSQTSNVSGDIRRIHASFFGNKDTQTEEITELERMYVDIVERELVGRLKAGVYGSDVEVSRDPEVYRIMFARACRNMKVQLLFIPEELLVYVAFDYNEYGIGQSLMSKSKIIAGIRAMLMLAYANGAMKNAIGRTDINVVLDEHDPEPGKTVEFALHEFSKVNAGAFPLGIGNPQDLLNYLQRASIKVNVEGNARYPGTKIDITDQRGDKNVPDMDIQEYFTKNHVQSFGLSPETVESAKGPDFATTVTHNNLLMSKRIQTYANSTGKFATKYVQTYTRNSETLMSELRTIVKEGWEKLTKEQKVDANQAAGAAPQRTLEEQYLKEKNEYLRTRYSEGGVEAVLMDFLTALKVSLPAPDTAALETQFAAIETYEKSLDKSLDSYISSTFITPNSVGDGLSQYAEEIKASLKAYYMRRYLRENNILPELDELTTFNDEDGPAIDLMQINEQHIESIARSVLKYAQALDAHKKQQEAAVAALGAVEGGGGASTGSGFSSSPTDTSTDTGMGDDPLLNGDATADATGDAETTPDGTEDVVEEESTTTTKKKDGEEETEETTTSTSTSGQVPTT